MTLPPGLLDLVSGAIGFLLTVMVLSYLIGDNALFRFAAHIFVGVSAGYIAVISLSQIIIPFMSRSFGPNAAMQDRLMALIPLFLIVLILMKISPQLSWLGGPAVGYMVGVGAAVAVSGAILGTIIPQIQDSASSFDATRSDFLFSALIGAVMLVGTVSTLVYFQFGARRQPDGSVKRNPIIALLAWIGQLFVAVTFGMLFAGVYSAALAAMIERLYSLIDFIRNLL